MAVSGVTKGVLAVLVMLVVLVGAGVGVVAWALGGEPGEGEPVSLQISEGTSAASVASILEGEGVVRSSLAFRLKARSSGLDRNLQAGSYELQTGMSVDEAIAVLLGGPAAPDSFTLTVPEGLTVEEILERLGERTPFTVEEYRAVLDAGSLTLPDWVPPADQLPAGVREPYEGLLFPETYEFAKDRATPQLILQRMVDQLGQVVASVPDEQINAAAGRGLDRYRAVVLASLVEEEAAVAEERSTVSGVIVNRLEEGRQLQIDASNLYAANEKGRVTQEYLDIDSPYNLYRHTGLPPTPISSPGRAAIEAAFAPEEHAFLYYVKKDEDGRHAFAETFEEHQRNVARFRELQDQADRESPSPAGSPSG